MGFIGKEIDRDTAKQLIERYKLTRPWPDNNKFLESDIVTVAKDKDSGAIYVQIQPQRGICVDGRQTQEYVPRIDALLWKGYNIRVDLYEEIHGDYFNGEIDSMSFTVKHIVAPQELKEESSKIKSLVEGGVGALFKESLLPKDRGRGYTFTNGNVLFVGKDKIWVR